MKQDGAKPRERRKGWYYRLSFPKKTALWGVIFLLPWLLGVFLLLIGLIRPLREAKERRFFL